MIENTQGPRGMSVNRVEALSDGVFAIAMTVLVLGIRVPDGGGAVGLRAQLGVLWPKFASYTMSFVMLGVLWIGHHFQFQYIRRTDRPLLWYNLVFLLFITFLPFSTAVLGNYFDNAIAVALYGGTVMVSGGCLLLHWRYATSRPQLVSADLEPAVIASIGRRIVVGLALTATATAAGFVAIPLSLGIFLLIPATYLVESRVDLHVAGRQTHP
jgi:uncharacterized membrane protein